MGGLFLTGLAGCFGADANAYGIKATAESIFWWPLFFLLWSLFLLTTGSISFHNHKEEPLLWIAGEREKSECIARDYERKAYLSFVEAIRQNPSLARKKVREVYDWIREHGVTVDGSEYELKDRATWERYRRGGEKLARDSQNSG